MNLDGGGSTTMFLDGKASIDLRTRKASDA
jgi:exopolysaccharide biosynthesis protein